MKYFSIIICIISVILFLSCGPEFEADMYFSQSTQISVGQILFAEEDFSFRCDSVLSDTRFVSGAMIYGGHVAVRFSISTPTLDTTLVDSLIYREGQLISTPEYINDHFEDGFYLHLTAVSPIPTLSEISQDEYLFTFYLEEGGLVARKPNIYFYPPETLTMSVSLDFPHGGRIIESIPAYPEKWQNITVTPEGRINGKYDYLFYEARTGDGWQYSHGWVVKKENLDLFFQINLEDYGFSESEIQDFLDFWIPELTETPYYAVYPQLNEQIDAVISLDCKPEADSVLRLFYVIKEMNGLIDLPEPRVPLYDPRGFTVREWGVILK